LFKEAEKVCKQENWNNYDKINIGGELKKKLRVELEKCDFLDNRKFEIMDEEIRIALKVLELN